MSKILTYLEMKNLFQISWQLLWKVDQIDSTTANKFYQLERLKSIIGN